MKILIKEQKDEKIRKICIPRCCCSLAVSILSRVLTLKSSKFISKNSMKVEVKPLSREQGKSIRKMVKYLNKNYKGLTIVDIETKGEIVKIVI